MNFYSIFAQALQTLVSKARRAFNNEEAIESFSFCILVKKREVDELFELYEFELYEEGDITSPKQITKRTDFVEVSVDVSKLAETWYAIEQAKRLTRLSMPAKQFPLFSGLKYGNLTTDTKKDDERAPKASPCQRKQFKSKFKNNFYDFAIKNQNTIY